MIDVKTGMTPNMGPRRVPVDSGARRVRWGETLTPSNIVYVEVDYDAPDSQGILVATRSLTVAGDWTWDGPILVVGEGDSTVSVVLQFGEPRPWSRHR